MSNTKVYEKHFYKVSNSKAYRLLVFPDSLVVIEYRGDEKDDRWKEVDRMRLRPHLIQYILPRLSRWFEIWDENNKSIWQEGGERE